MGSDEGPESDLEELRKFWPTQKTYHCPTHLDPHHNKHKNPDRIQYNSATGVGELFRMNTQPHRPAKRPHTGPGSP